MTEDYANNWVLMWESLVADTWDDTELNQRLLDDPWTVLEERGMTVPEGVTVNVIEGITEVHTFLSTWERAEVAGGARAVERLWVKK